MKKIILKAPFNSLSLGNVSYNIARELYKKDVSVSIFPYANNFDFSAFDRMDEDFKKWMESSTQSRYYTLSKDDPCLSIWHLNESVDCPGKKTFLYTFYETDNPTFSEKKVCDYHDHVIFSSSYAQKNFLNIDCKNTSYVPLGFDEDFHITEKKYFEDKIHFGLVGKWEKRKNTETIIKSWIKKFGNNPKYQLTCCVLNPFFKTEEMNLIIGRALDNKHYTNVNFLPRLNTNSEINDLINSIDIDLSGLSGAEGWNLPAFNATCLGKWSTVLNATSHTDWANKNNSIIIEPEGKQDIFDGLFFKEGSDFNQGEMYSLTEDMVVNALELAISFKGKSNPEGEKLKEKFSYSNTVDSILETISSNV